MNTTNSPGARRHPLDSIFLPRNVAVIGATEATGSVGRTVLSNLLAGAFGGRVFPVNPKRPTVLGAPAFPNITSLPEKADLAVIVTPAAVVPDVVGQCAAAGVKAAVIISAGFREIGASGAELERRVLEHARSANMRLIGPNCLGVMNPITGMNATFAKGMALPGTVAFISQSGALMTAILDWSRRENVGFSAFVSTGSMLDVGWGDLIDYLGDDPRTKSILIYMESVGDARAFLSAARAVSLNKPIIIIKAGRTEAAARAAASHTGSLTGSDEVLDAAFRRCGVLRVRRIAELFYMADVLGKQPRPQGPRLTIVTNAGGPGVLATDALLAADGELAVLDEGMKQSLNSVLPPQWSHNNPIDVLGDAPPQRFADAIKIAAADMESDGLLVVLTPQDMTDPTKTAEAIAPLAHIPGKPLLASWMGAADVADAQRIFSSAGIPVFDFPDSAARAFAYMWRYTYSLQGLYQTPAADEEAEGLVDRAAAAGIIEQNFRSGKAILDEHQSKELLAAYGIPVVRTLVAADAEQAGQIAEKLGFPLALKLYSHTITHKTDVGGVKLNLSSRGQLAAAFEEIRQSVSRLAGAEHFQGVTVQTMVNARDSYELIIGASPDPQFGPVLLFGLGGQLVEVLKDRALALPPLNATLALRMMEQTKIYRALKGVRGRKSVDLARLCRILVRFSQLVVEQPRIKEIEMNPLLAGSENLIALDARVVLWGSETPDSRLPRPAIRPYPTQYVEQWSLKDGTPITIRPIRPEDEPLLVRFHQQLSEQSVTLRYFHQVSLDRRIEHERLTRVCFNDYDRELALVAEARHEGQRSILGVGRMVKLLPMPDAEFSLLIADPWQHQGLGTELLKLLLRIARDEKVERLVATIMRENFEMRRLVEQFGFTLSGELTDSTIQAVIRLA